MSILWDFNSGYKFELLKNDNFIFYIDRDSEYVKRENNDIICKNTSCHFLGNNDKFTMGITDSGTYNIRDGDYAIYVGNEYSNKVNYFIKFIENLFYYDIFYNDQFKKHPKYIELVKIYRVSECAIIFIDNFKHLYENDRIKLKNIDKFEHLYENDRIKLKNIDKYLIYTIR